MNSTSLPSTPAQELYRRLRWFGRLRWLAVGSLAVASLGGPQFGVPQLWPKLLYVAGVVAAYNLYFHWALGRPGGEERSLTCRQVQAVAEIVLDLSALLVTVHLTGGVRSPLLPFFIFHMAIGTRMLYSRTMYTLAAATSLGVFGLYLAEASGILKHRPIDPTVTEYGPASDLSMVTLIVTIFGTVYLTGTVTRQVRQRTSELERALDEIHELERRKSHYMRISAHQLRSPLATVKTSLQVITGGYADPASERSQKMLHGTVERVDSLLAIVNDLLELAKIREGQRKAPWTGNVDVRSMLDEILKAVKATAESRQVRLVTDLKGAAVLSWGVPPDLRFALENVMQNAMRYSRLGGEVRVGLHVSGGEATISVADRGIGIPKELQRDVFLEFVRAPNAKHHAPQGTGLGLTIVKEAVEMHGGCVLLHSKEGVGTTVTVQLVLRNSLPPGARLVTPSGNAEGRTPA